MNECLKMTCKCKIELRNMYYDGMMKEYAFSKLDNYLSSLIAMLEAEGDDMYDSPYSSNIDSLDYCDV